MDVLENFQYRNKTTNQYESWWLVGIGVNVESYPQQLPTEKEDSGANKIPRSATCLSEYIDMIPTSKKIDESLVRLDLARDISFELMELIDTALGASTTPTSSSKGGGDKSDFLLQEWRSYANLGQSYTIRQTGEIVTTIDVESNGQLRVRGQDGKIRSLIADYFH